MLQGLWSSELKGIERAPQIHFREVLSHEPHPSVLDDPAPAAAKARGCTTAISGSKSCYLMNLSLATKHFISPSARTRYTRASFHDLKYHMLVAGHFAARAPTPVPKSQHLSQQYPANAFCSLPRPQTFSSVPNFSLSFSPILILHLTDNPFVLSATHA